MLKVRNYAIFRKQNCNFDFGGMQRVSVFICLTQCPSFFRTAVVHHSKNWKCLKQKGVLVIRLARFTVK